MLNEINDYLSAAIRWKQTENPRFPYTSDFNGERLTIRVNNFPDEPLYTLIVNETRELDFEDWSVNWKRPVKTARPVCQGAAEH